MRPAAAGGDRPRPRGARREVAAHARSRARCTLGRLSSRRPHSAGSAQGPRSLSQRLAREAHPGSARWRQGRYHGVERVRPALPHPGGVRKREAGRLASRGQPSDLGRRGRRSHAAPLRGGGAQPAVWPPSAPSPHPGRELTDQSPGWRWEGGRMRTLR